MQQEGIIVKGIAGFYYVINEADEIYECKARGRFRKEKLSPIVGDRVIIESEEDGKGVIVELLPRRSELIRPSVANVDQALIIFALKKPDININMLDKLLVICEYNGIESIICLNKTDLDTEESFNSLREIYETIGYKVIRTNGLTGEGIEEIKSNCQNRISVLVGPSGVGKSTVFNRLQDRVRMETGNISLKIDRGRHTTRHAELIEIEKNSYIVDTPGFSSIDMKFLKPEELQYEFREFRNYTNQCKYSSCLHYKENDCTIKRHVEEGRINASRYNSYAGILEELMESNRRGRR